MTRFLWLQERVALRHIQIIKVKGVDNPSDILTKAVGRETLERHLKSIGLEEVRPHKLHRGIVAGISCSAGSSASAGVGGRSSLSGELRGSRRTDSQSQPSLSVGVGGRSAKRSDRGGVKKSPNCELQACMAPK
eukprot:3616972-Amphidinium_carterae.1